MAFQPLFLFSDDKVFDYPSQYLPPSFQFESKRTLCFFPLRPSSTNPNLEYLSKGLAEVIYSSFNGFSYVFDSSPLVDVITYEFGNPKNRKKTEKKETPKPTLNELNSGAKTIPIMEDPRYIKLETKFIDTKPILLEEALGQGKKNNCFYILTGEYSVAGEDALQIRLELTERKEGKTKLFTENTTIKRAFQEWQTRSTRLKQYFLSEKGSGITVRSGTVEGAYVYIDGEYIGKTPVTRVDVLAGIHTVLVNKEGFTRVEKKVTLEAGQIFDFDFPLEKILEEGFVSVNSNPPGASVYIGSKYLGETPLNEVSVPTGINRLRIIKENYIDEYKSVEIRKGDHQKWDFSLKTGDTSTYYKNRLNVFLDYNYFDFSLYSLYGSFIFYGMYMYSGLRADKDRDNLYAITQVNGISLLSSLQSLQTSYSESAWNTLLGSLLYQQTQINLTTRNTDRYERYQAIGTGGVFTMLSLSGIFLYLGLNSDAFEFGYNPIRTPQGNGSEASFQWKFRF
jgi:hypothetical protein